MTVGRFNFVLWYNDRAYQEMDDLLRAMHQKYEFAYLHFAPEVAPTTGRKHIDGYYEYPTQRKWVTEQKKFIKAFGSGFGDLQAAHGTAGENMDYSEKESAMVVLGTPAHGQGFRTDLLENRNDILEGRCTAEDIALADPQRYHQYARTFHKIEDIALRKKFRTEMTKGIWYHGPTGVGKSHRAFDGFTPETHYVWKNDKGWQDGYTGQPTVIINDFRGELPYNELLQLVDKWPYTLSRRGREPVPFLATKLIVTSSLSPDQVYHRRDVEDSLDQLNRRFLIVKLTSKSDFASPVKYQGNFEQWL